MIRQIYFIRGASGTGKTTLAREMAEKWGLVHVEADQFFERGGKYIFSAAKLGVAHSWARGKVADALRAGKSVVISNTSTRISEVEQYLVGVPSDVVVTSIDLKREGSRAEYKNVHGVPTNKVIEHAQRFQPFPEDRRGPAKAPDGSALQVADADSYQIARAQ